MWSQGALAARRQARISKITIRSTDIFDFGTKPYLKKFPYTWINLLHFQTKESIIRQELLFKEGDEVDDFLIDETERNLRALPFIRAARIGKFPQRDGTVALVIYTGDSWTTEPQINIGGINNIDELEFKFREKSVLGYGKTFDISYGIDSDSDFIKRSYRYKDPRVGGSRWQFEAELLNDNNGQEKIVDLRRPFFSADTRWSSGGTFRKSDILVKVFDQNNQQISGFDLAKEISEFSGAVKIGRGRRWVHREGLRYRQEHQNFSSNEQTALSRPIPENQKFQTIFWDLETVRNKFVKLTRVEKLLRVEDFNLGPTLSLSPGISPRKWTGKKNDATEFQSAYQQEFLFYREHFLRTKLKYSSRNTFEDTSNIYYEIDTRYYHRQSPLQTFVAHTRLEWGEDLDSDSLIFLGGTNGLRAFEADEIVGTKSLLLNLEDRIYLSEEIADLFALGAVVFFDSGYVWPENQPVAFSQLRSDIGAGLRIALTRSSNEVLVRIDVSYRLHKIHSDDPDFVVSFGSGQAF